MPEVPVRMPKFSMAQEEGQLLTWAKKEGDTVTAGEMLCEVATDKVNMEVESPFSGTITKLLAQPNQDVPVGEPIAMVLTEADDLLDGLLDGPADQPVQGSGAGDVDGAVNGAPSVGPTDGAGDMGAATPPSRKSRQPAMPGVRRRAGALNVDLASITGSGRAGVITMADVERAVTQATTVERPPAPAPTPQVPRPGSEALRGPAPAAPDLVAESSATGDRGPMPGIDPRWSDALAERRRSIRAVVGRRMTESAAVPQFTAFADIDLEALDRARDGVGWTALWTRALAQVLRQQPELNTVWESGEAQPQGHVGVSIAVDTPVGLLAPVIRDPDAIDVGELDAQLRRTIDRARTGRLTAPDLDGGTVTLSNLGGLGVHSFQALVTPPQVAVLSLGAVAPQPVVRNGGLAVRLRCRVGLTVDHRVADGADAARALADLTALMSRPEDLLAPAGATRLRRPR